MENSYGGPAVNIAAGDEMIFASRPKKMQLPVCDKTVITEISEDFALPDYQPEIRRLLKVTPSVSTPSRYISRSLAEFSGNVAWTVLYVGGDGSIAQAKLASPYEAAADFETQCDVNADSFASDEISVENAVGRVTAPRKLNIRGRLKHRIQVFGEDDTEAELKGEAPAECIKKLTQTLPVNILVGGTDDSIELEDSFQLPENCSAIGAGANIIVDSCDADESGMICKGNIYLKLLYINEERSANILEHKLPFTANAVCELDGDGWNCRAYGELIDISVDTDENNTAVCRIRAVVNAEAQKNLPIQFTTDIFSTSSKCEKELKTQTLPCSLANSCYAFSHDGSAVIEGLPEGSRIIDSECSALPESLTLEKGRYVLSGKCRYSTLFGADSEYSVREVELPFRCELDTGSEAPTDFSAIISVASCRVRPEGENFAFSADLNAAVRICGQSELQCVTEASFDGDLEARNAAFTVAYTAPGDSLWDIAKRYSADPASLAEANGLRVNDISSPESLSGVKYLII